MTCLGKDSIIKKKVYQLSIITLMFFLLFFVNPNLITSNLNSNDSIKSEITVDHQPHIANGESILFQGTESALNITDYGILYESNQVFAYS
ncbi:unnamed protein product, partial [marine sediment metagenome]